MKKLLFVISFFYWKEHEWCLAQLQLNDKHTEGFWFELNSIAPAGF